MQKKHREWHDQWRLLQDEDFFLFDEWIAPRTLKDFLNKEVLECGCGGGQHTLYLANQVKSIVAVNLNTLSLAKSRLQSFRNITFLEDDIGKMEMKKLFDIVFSIGVIHHTDNPQETFFNIKRFLKKGGLLIIWVYSKEGNWLVENFVEPVRKAFLRKLSREVLLALSRFITFLMYIPIYSLYLLPLSFLPFYQYFKNFRKLSFYRNTLNVFDKLNAPQTIFLSRETITAWFNSKEFTNITIRHHQGVSWSASGYII